MRRSLLAVAAVLFLSATALATSPDSGEADGAAGSQKIVETWTVDVVDVDMTNGYTLVIHVNGIEVHNTWYLFEDTYSVIVNTGDTIDVWVYQDTDADFDVYLYDHYSALVDFSEADTGITDYVCNYTVESAGCVAGGSGVSGFLALAAPLALAFVALRRKPVLAISRS